MPKPRVDVVVLGIDGLDYKAALNFLWRLDGPLGRLAREGSILPLRSTIPPNTASAWVSIFTGVNPAEHGVFKFSSRDGRLVSSRDVKRPFIWEILSHLRMRSIVVNVPMTWPPSPLLGCMVSGMPAPPHSNFVYPQEICGRLVPPNYKPDLPLEPLVLNGDSPHRVVDELTRLERQKVDAFLRIAGERRWSLGILTPTALDRISHSFWMGESGGRLCSEL